MPDVREEGEAADMRAIQAIARVEMALRDAETLEEARNRIRSIHAEVTERAPYIPPIVENEHWPFKQVVSSRKRSAGWKKGQRRV